MTARAQLKSLSVEGPFTRAQALASGFTDGDLRTRHYQRIFHGIYVASSVRVTPLVRAKAALLVSPPGAYASHHTAVLLWGGVPPMTSCTHVSVQDLAGVRSVRRGIRSHRAVPEPRLSGQVGAWVSNPVQAFLELATVGVDLVDLVVSGDSLVKAVRLPPETFVKAADGWRGRGATVARRAARLIRAGVDSPQETRLRLLIVLAGLPEPEVNWTVYRADGTWLRRYDLYYPRYRLIVEYDGRQHAESDHQWGVDVGRREELDDLNIRIYVVRSAGIHEHPGVTLEKIYALLKQRGATGLPSRLNPQWSRYFPGRD